MRRSDEALGAPGGETLRELFGGEPTLILLDELALYLRNSIRCPPNAAVVYTLVVGKDNRATDP